METANRPDWLKLFESILTEPGKLGNYYRAFHNYSLGNQALAMEQLSMRGIQIAPIASFNAWKAKGRKVMKGQKAIALWMPVTFKRKGEDDPKPTEKPEGEKGETTRRIFVMRNHWFAHSQTEVDPLATDPEPEVPETEISWDKDQAAATLGMIEETFKSVNGNTQGYAHSSEKRFAINPLAGLPYRTRFHEMAHCILHGTDEVMMVDGSSLERCLKEAEAESTAFLCCAALGLPGLAEARGYVQDWLHGDTVARESFKKSAGRIFSAADKILKAGLVVRQLEEQAA